MFISEQEKRKVTRKVWNIVQSWIKFTVINFVSFLIGRIDPPDRRIYGRAMCDSLVHGILNLRRVTSMQIGILLADGDSLINADKCYYFRVMFCE